MTTPRTDDTTELPWAQTQTIPYAARQAPAPDTAPALNPPTWTGRKTAIAAALAIGISSLGAVGAAAALPAGTILGDSGQVQRGAVRTGQVGRDAHAVQCRA